MLPGQFDVKDKLVVISGGSQGLGAEFAKQVFSRGASVIVMARTESKLQETITDIEEHRVSETQTVGYRSVDLAVYADVEKAMFELDPDVVFFCAGSALPKLFTELTPTELEQGVNLNLKTSVNLAHIVMKKMSSAKKEYSRHLVFCSSILAVFPFIGYGQYAPSKAGVRALADVLRHEGYPYDIKVHTIFAGNFQSEGFEKEEETKPEITKAIEGPSNAIPVEKCANIILWFLDHGYESIFTDLIGWALSCGMLGFSPRFFGVFQALIALLLALITPIYMIFVRRDINGYFSKKK